MHCYVCTQPFNQRLYQGKRNAQSTSTAILSGQTSRPVNQYGYIGANDRQRSQCVRDEECRSHTQNVCIVVALYGEDTVFLQSAWPRFSPSREVMNKSDRSELPTLLSSSSSSVCARGWSPLFWSNLLLADEVVFVAVVKCVVSFEGSAVSLVRTVTVQTEIKTN